MAAAASAIPRLISVVRPWPASALVSYVTDVEGNVDYFRAFVERSRVVRFANDDDVGTPPARVPPAAHGQLATSTDGGARMRLARLDFRDAKQPGYFVFGGDVGDKGPGDVRLARVLVDFKRRYPDRVFLIVGNRDLNKLRFTSELDPVVIDDPASAEDAAYPYWVESAKRVSPKQYLHTNGLANTRANRLRWMLQETMGADGTFEHRRRELELLRTAAAPVDTVISDDQVVASFVGSVLPDSADAFMRDFLLHGQLAVILGPHLFVHGAVTAASLGRVPGIQDPLPEAEAWVTRLNQWMQLELAEHAARPAWGPHRGSDRGGDALMDYGLPGGFGGATVVYASNLDNGKPASVAPAVLNYLRASGISSVVCGHVPHGDCPTVISAPALRIITADTSYSDMTQPDNRGTAVSEVLLAGDGSAQVHGVLRDGRAIDYKLAPPTASESPADLAAQGFETLVGHRLGDAFVKATLRDTPDQLLVCQAEGRQLNVREMARSDVEAAMAIQ